MERCYLKPQRKRICKSEAQTRQIVNKDTVQDPLIDLPKIGFFALPIYWEDIMLTHWQVFLDSSRTLILAGDWIQAPPRCKW